jgi:hypothetical protein
MADESVIVAPAASVGIVETKEVLHGALLLAAKIIVAAKSNKGIVEIGADLVSDSDLRSALAALIDNVSKVPAEAKDLSSEEIVELVILAAQDSLKIVSALKA